MNISYKETVDTLEEMLADGVVTVKRGAVQAEDAYKMTDYGFWLSENDLLTSYACGDSKWKKKLRLEFETERVNALKREGVK